MLHLFNDISEKVTFFITYGTRFPGGLLTVYLRFCRAEEVNLEDGVRGMTKRRCVYGLFFYLWEKTCPNR